jgi:hypothetical protein
MARSRKLQQSLKHRKLYPEQTPVCLMCFELAPDLQPR